jgi:hypothetical protein
MAVRLRRLSYPLGAEVCDIDVSAPIGESDFGEIYQAFLDQALGDFDETQSRYMERSTVLGTPLGYVAA